MPAAVMSAGSLPNGSPKLWHLGPGGGMIGTIFLIFFFFSLVEITYIVQCACQLLQHELTNQITVFVTTIGIVGIVGIVRYFKVL